MSQTDKTLRSVIFALLFSVAIIPFVVSDSMLFPYITGKGFAFRLAAEAAFFLWLALAVRCPEYRPRWQSPTLVALGAFLLVLTLADFFAYDQTLALWSKFERMEGLSLMLHFGAYALVLSAMLQTAADWRRLLGLHVLAAAVMAVYAATQLLGLQDIRQGGVRVDGTFGNAVYLAGYMLFSIGFAAFLSLREENQTLRRLYFGAAVAFAVILTYTATRGSALGLGAALVFSGAAFLTFGRGNPYRKIGAWVVGVATLGLVLFAVGREIDVVRNHPIFGRYVGVSFEDKTLLSRLVNAETAWKGFLDRPLLGWGQGNYTVVFDRYYDLRLHDHEQYFDHTHSILTDWLVAAGGLGFLTYFALLCLVARGLWRAEGLRADERVVLLALLAGYLVHNLFVFDNVVSYAHYATLVGLAIALGPARESRRMSIGADGAALAVSACILALPIVAYAVNAAPMSAARSVIDAMSAPSLEAARDDFEGAIVRGTFGTPEVAYQYAQYAARVAAAKEQLPADARAAFVAGADAALADAALASQESYYDYGLGAFRLRVGDLPGAVASLEVAVAEAPKKQSVRAALALAYAWAGDPRALDYARETYEIEPGNEPAWRAYARVASKVGRADIFNQLIEEARAAGLHEWIVTLAREGAATSPANPQARASLIRALSDAGFFEDALAELDRAVADFPEAAAQLELFRASIEARRAAAQA